jgi:Tol biopolymer transport system component
MNARRTPARLWTGVVLFGVVIGLGCPYAEAQFGFTQITKDITHRSSDPKINATGTRIAFVSQADLAPGSPGNSDGNREIFLFDTTTGVFTQITNTTGGGVSSNGDPTIDATGTRIAFNSNRDLTPGDPGNPDGNREIFLFDTTNGLLTQVTNTTGGGANDLPSINADGTRVAFVSNRDLTPRNPGNADGNDEIFLVDTTTGRFTQITRTDDRFCFNSTPSINADGTRIAFVSSCNLMGDNHSRFIELYLFDTTIGGLIPITSLRRSSTVETVSASPSINADGTRIAFVSERDLTPGEPGNADGNDEIFLFDTTTGRFTQVTNTTGDAGLGPANGYPSINAAGTRIAFLSTRDLTPGQPGNAVPTREVFVFDATTGRFTQVTKTPRFSIFITSPSINAAGTRMAFVSNHDVEPTGGPSPGGRQDQIFLASTRVPGDFDNDLRKDLAVYRPSTGQWFISGSATGFRATIFGTPAFGALGDTPVPADFDGDGKTDLAIFQSSIGQWSIFGGATGFLSTFFPASRGLDDIPVPADFDGDGKADLAVYRQATGEWFILGSSSGLRTIFFGAPAGSGFDDTPVPADFDGDGKADFAVYRRATGEWFIQGSATGFRTVVFGAPAVSGLGDVPLAADFDGDGKADLAIYRQATGEWLIFRSATGFRATAFGAPAVSGLGDIPVPGDFDGDGKADLAVYRSTTGEWFVLRSLDGLTQTTTFGAPGDLPLR